MWYKLLYEMLICVEKKETNCGQSIINGAEYKGKFAYFSKIDILNNNKRDVVV